MKDLHTINPSIAHPRAFGSLGALLPFVSGLFCIPLAVGVAPQTSFGNNILAVFSTVLTFVALFLFFIPHIFRWDWRAKYFGVSLLYVGSVGFLGVVPLLGIVLYSAMPIVARLVIVIGYSASILWWCRRFVTYYRHLFSDETLWRTIYNEESDAIYYLQAEDQRLIEHRFRVGQFPSNFAFISFMALAFLVIPFATDITLTVGVSFIHVFLAICMAPVVLMCFGLAVRGYLIYYYYPWKLKRETGKDVFVIMAIRNVK